MSWSIRLFRVKGIEVKVHLTFVLILVWAAYRWGVGLGQGAAGALSGAWTLVIIAVFIYLGAGQEGRMVEVKNTLEGLRVRQAMTPEIAFLSPRAPVSVAVDHILHGFQTDFPVIEDGRLVGFLTEIDLVSALKETGPQTAVKQVMRTDVEPARPDEPLFEVQMRMRRMRLRALPVVEEDRLVGLISSQDVGEAVLFVRLRPGLVKMK